jgi:hypothetical protein
LLGKPSHESDLRGKTWGELIWHELDYYIKQVDIGEVNTRDQYVTLDFDGKGHLQQIDYNAMKPVATGDTSYIDYAGIYQVKPPPREKNNSR